MDPVLLMVALGTAAAALIGAGGVAYARLLGRDLAPIRDLARRWGRPPTPGMGSSSVVGRLSGRRVHALATGRGVGGKVRMWVRVEGPKELCLVPNLPGEPGQAIGVDEEFDRAVRGSGPGELLRALAVGGARHRVLDALGVGCHLGNGVVWWTGPVGTSADELQRIAALLVSLADATAHPREVSANPETLGKDPRSVRRHALRQTALLAGKRTSELDPSVVRAMLRDPDARVAVAAARSLADVAALWELAQAEEPARRTVALVALAEMGADPRRVEAGLLALLAAGAADEEVLGALGAVGSGDAIGPLRPLVGFGLNARARAAADAIARIQARSGLSPGALDHAPTGGGELAEAEPPAGGGVSLPPDG